MLHCRGIEKGKLHFISSNKVDYIWVKYLLLEEELFF